MKIGEVKRYLSLLPPQHSVLILGPPGIGKSRAVREFAEEEAQRMGREFIEYDDAVNDAIKEDPQRYYIYFDLRLTEVEPSDLIGLPRDMDGYVMYKQLAWSHTFSLPGVAGLLFLDEITNVRRDDLLAVSYKIVLDRRAGFRKFSDLVRVIAAGNDPAHSSIANMLPAPLANRFSIFIIEAPTVEEWTDYVRTAEGGVDYRIAGYLMRFREDILYKSEPETLTNYPTPRSWSRLNEIIRGKELDEKTVKELAAALVGPTVAAKFAAFCRLGELLPPPEKIIERPESLDDVIAAHKLTTVDVLYYSTASVAQYIADHQVEPARAISFIQYIVQKQADLLVVFLIMLPREMRTMYIADRTLYTNSAVKSVMAEISKYLL